MSSYMITARRIRGGTFDAEPGRARFLTIPQGDTDPTLEHEVKRRDDWFEAVRNAADGQPNANSISKTGDVLFYIHGFNVTMASALWRQRQLDINLRAQGWTGQVVGFDWPSNNKVLNYWEDRRDGGAVADLLITRAVKHFACGQPANCETNVHILAHSAGAYVMVMAFLKAMEDGEIYKSDFRLGQVAIISGDISSRSLVEGHERTAPMFDRIMRLTNYQNPFDYVLGVSNAKRLGTSPRSGRVGLPKDPHPKAVNVNCGDWFRDLDPSTLTLEPNSVVPHTWYISDPMFCRDLAMTLEGAFDRHAIPTRKLVDGELVLTKGTRPAQQGNWMNVGALY